MDEADILKLASWIPDASTYVFQPGGVCELSFSLGSKSHIRGNRFPNISVCFQRPGCEL
jgi:hypothetical protein